MGLRLGPADSTSMDGSLKFFVIAISITICVTRILLKNVVQNAYLHSHLAHFE
jgi:hypothetical protein